MESVLGAPLHVFIGLTIILFGGCGFLTGQGAAESWKPETEVYGYTLLLTFGDRFLVYGLFDGSLLSPWGFLVHGAVIGAIAVLSYRIARARRMVSQYPWLYERSGPFTWRERPGAGIAG